MPNQMLFLMLIKVTEQILTNQNLRNWMDEIEEDYMDEFGELGASIAHLVLEGGAPWHFALVFPGSPESADYLRQAILNKDAQTEILTMRGRDLDEFRAASAQ